jgi:hypothetical protein
LHYNVIKSVPTYYRTTNNKWAHYKYCEIHGVFYHEKKTCDKCDGKVIDDSETKKPFKMNEK